MTPEERDLISGLFSRLKSADTPAKDRDADDHIRRLVTEVPSAPYLLTQTALVQEQALKSAESHIANLEQQLADARRAGQSLPSSGSFLGRMRRPWETAAPQPAAPQAPAYAPQPSYAAPQYAATPSGGGFLHSALSTAAGVAGGALLFSGIERLLGHNPGPFGGYGGFGASGSPWGGNTPAENVTVNNYYGDDANQARTTSADADDTADSGAQYTDAGYDTDDGGSDFGGDGGGSFDV